MFLFGAADVSAADLPGAVNISAIAEMQMSDEDFVPSKSVVESVVLVSMDEVASGDGEVVQAALQPPPSNYPRRWRNPLRALLRDFLRPSVSCGTTRCPEKRSVP